MLELQHPRLDLLKLDVEGAEFAVLSAVLDAGVHPKVLCGEFDQPANPMSIWRMVKRLRRHRYTLVSIDVWNFTFINGGLDGAHASTYRGKSMTDIGKLGIPPTPLLASLERQNAYSRQPKWLRAAQHPAIGIRVAAARALRHYHPEVTAKLFTGQSLRVILPDTVSERLYLHGVWEPNLTSFIVEALQPGMVMIDVGAHYGYYSQLACLQVGSQGKVIAFEPTPGTREVLERNLAGYEAATVEPLALYSRAQALQLQDFGTDHAGFNTLTPEARPVGSGRAPRVLSVQSISAIRLDDYCGDRGVKPDLVKIDAEGTEWHVLTGMGDLLGEDGPMVTIETGDFGKDGKGASRKCVDLLLSRGYRVYEPSTAGLAVHQLRDSYGYDNLAFIPARFWSAPWCP